LGEEYKSFSSSLCNLLHSPVTSSLLGPNILLNTMFLQLLLLASNAGGWVGNVARMGEKKNANIILVRITEERNLLKTWA